MCVFPFFGCALICSCVCAGGCRVANLFVFNPKGEIIHCHLNAPGSWHNSSLSEELYDLLDHRVPDGYVLVADTAFTGSPKLLKPLRQDQIASLSASKHISVRELCQEIKRHRVAVSVRQAAEWGMRALQGTWGRLQVPLPANSQDRMLILELIARMHNFRTRRVGLNQIKTV